MADLTHFNDKGQAHMVNVGEKDSTHRIAVAEGCISMHESTLKLISEGNHKKGDVLGIARIAGIMGSKRTADLVPLCHPIPLTHVDIELQLRPELPGVYCRCQTETRGQTGIEIEALCATQVTLLTIYDMCKAVDRGMCIENVQLVEKLGGKSGHWKRGHFET